MLRQPIPDVIITTATATALVAIRTHLRTSAGITELERIIQHIAVPACGDGPGTDRPTPRRG